MEPGDVIIVLQLKEHDTFTRKGHDLHCSYSLGLTESLCGFHFTLKQLDQRDLVISQPRGDVIKPGYCSMILLSEWINTSMLPVQPVGVYLLSSYISVPNLDIVSSLSVRLYVQPFRIVDSDYLKWILATIVLKSVHLSVR